MLDWYIWNVLMRWRKNPPSICTKSSKTRCDDEKPLRSRSIRSQHRKKSRIGQDSLLVHLVWLRSVFVLFCFRRFDNDKAIKHLASQSTSEKWANILLVRLFRINNHFRSILREQKPWFFCSPVWFNVIHMFATDVVHFSWCPALRKCESNEASAEKIKCCFIRKKSAHKYLCKCMISDTNSTVWMMLFAFIVFSGMLHSQIRGTYQFEIQHRLAGDC